MEAFTDFEEKITCPYDNSHIIMRSRMSIHLVKCAENFPNTEKVICDFNSTHRVPRPELKYHHEICPDRRKIESQIIEKEGENPAKFYPVQQVNTCDEEESWDEEPEHPGYNPTLYCTQNNVLRHIDVKSSAKRRNFRAEERERLSVFKSSSSTSRTEPKPSSSTTGAIPKTTQGTSVRRNPGFPAQPSGGVSIEEDAPQFSLIDRINKGKGKLYEPKQ